jgi:hypothetical protein
MISQNPSNRTHGSGLALFVGDLVGDDMREEASSSFPVSLPSVLSLKIYKKSRKFKAIYHLHFGGSLIEHWIYGCVLCFIHILDNCMFNIFNIKIMPCHNVVIPGEDSF